MPHLRPRLLRGGLLASLGAIVLSAAGCSSSAAVAPPPGSEAGSSRSAAAGSSPGTRSAMSSSTASHAATSRAETVLASMTEKQRVGQLLMVDCPTSGVAAATVTAIQRYDVGAVILDGTTTSGAAAIRRLTSRLEDENPSKAKLFIATDQEGGEVQRLQGTGFSTIPSAVQQGRLTPATLQSDATTWGRQLRAAGVTIDLAPVLDTVPAGGAPNPPIGDLDREYGHTPAVVASHGVAFARGLAAAGVDATAKHFPGLGRVTGNTDVASGVTDTVTTRDDAYLAPFGAAVKAGVPFVMMSTAIYAKIDPGVPAAFSRTIVTGMLRDELGFRGVIITDDLGAAKQVAAYSPGTRAVRFVEAGGDMVLTVDASEAAAMTKALLAKADSDPAFKKLVDAATLQVLEAKQARGLLPR